MLLATVQLYSPPTFPVRVWMYCAVFRLTRTVLVPSVILVLLFLVQVTVVTGPPIEVQIMVNGRLSPCITLMVLMLRSPLVSK